MSRDCPNQSGTSVTAGFVGEFSVSSDMDTTGPRIHPLLLALLLALTTAAAIGAEVDRSKTDSGLFPGKYQTG